MPSYLLAGGLYKLRVGVVCDEWNWQIPEVQFQCTSDNVDIFIHKLMKYLLSHHL